MTEREVEIQTTETQTVKICDYCGLGEDEGEGQMRTFRETCVSGGGETVHFHDKCVRAGLGDLGPMPSIRDASEWGILFAGTPGDAFLFGFGVASIYAGYNSTLGTPGLFDLTMLIVGGFLILAMTVTMIKQARDALDEIGNNWWRFGGGDE